MTTISARLLGFRPEELGEPVEPAEGVGGLARAWRVNSVRLRLRDETKTVILDITPDEVFTVENVDDVCLLGRDVLRKHGLALSLDVVKGGLHLEN